MSITRHVLWWLPLLAAGMAAAVPADEASSAVVVSRLLTTGDEATAAAGLALLDAAQAGLHVVVRGEVRTVTEALNTHLLDDLRLLPDGLATALGDHKQAAGVRYGFCLRSHEGQAGELVVELAAVDFETRSLRGYRTVAAVPDEAPAAVGGAIIELARQALPLDLLSGDAASWRSPATPLAEAVSELAAAADGALVRDTMAVEGPVVEPRNNRPQPHPAAAPVEALLSRPRSQVPARPLQSLEVTQLMAQFAGRMASLGGYGEASGAVRVLEREWELLLLPTDARGPNEPPVRVQVQVFGVDENAEVVLRSSRPLETAERGRSGNWISLDILGFTPETDTLLDIDRSGLLGLHVKPVGDAATRVGFQLTGAGDVSFAVSRDGQEVTAEVCKSDERLKLAEPDGPLPFGGNFTVRGVSRGQASWYGGRWHGGPTASGERYNQWGWTAAHKTLPLGSWVRVTNLRNGKQVYLRINDRGPYVRGRIIDTSVTAAKALGFYGAGVTPVQVEALKPTQ